MNKRLLRRLPICACACATFFFILQILDKAAVAQPDALEDCMERLAIKVAALPHERRMTLVWRNHAALSETRLEQLRAAFAERVGAVQVKLVQGETAPALLVAIEQTPSRIVFTATVPGEGSSNVAIEEVERAAAGMAEGEGNQVRLEKKLLWQQETRVLSAALLPAAAESGEKRLALMTEDALLIFGGEPGNWKLQHSKVLPGPRAPARSARGQVVVAEDQSGKIGILLPGRRCEASAADESPLVCVATSVEWPAGRLIAAPNCGTQTWWLRSDEQDFASEGRLLLRNAGNGKDVAPVAELEIAGPAISIAAGDSAGSATLTERNLSSGNYEVYRVAVTCGE